MGLSRIDLWSAPLKEIFGNRKNYYRYLAAKELNQWNAWLISLGWRA
jgi:hypothetical protein